MSIDNLRIGKNYFLRNFGETSSFVVLETIGKDDFRLKDLLTMEMYLLSDLIRFGMGSDFDLYELD
jgi:hypothetical protein